MPLGPGGLDSNGIWLYGEDDSEALASDLLNIGMQSVSDAIGGGLGAILQVVSTNKTDTFTTTSTSFVDVTGYSATITPTSASSKILISMNYFWSQDGDDRIGSARTLRDSTVIYAGDSSADRQSGSDAMWNLTTQFGLKQIGLRNQVTFLDNPETTSSVTYKMQVKQDPRGGSTITFNRSGVDATSPSGAYIRTASSITLMEVAG